MKVIKNKTESFYILGYLLKLITKLLQLEKNSLQNQSRKFGFFSFHEKSFALVKIIFFRSKFGKTLLVKETLISMFRFSFVM
jgi:hypothetical protein